MPFDPEFDCQDSRSGVGLPAREREKASGRFDQNDFSEIQPDALTLFKDRVERLEQIELELAKVELQTERRTAKEIHALCPLKNCQALEAFDWCASMRNGEVPKSAVDRFIETSGVLPHPNDRIACSLLLRAIRANAQRTKGAPVTKRSSPRLSTCASAIDFALETSMPREEFLQHLRGERRNGKRQGLNYLAKQGRLLRSNSPAPPNILGDINAALSGLALKDGELGSLIFERSGSNVVLRGAAKTPSGTSEHE